MNEKIFLFVHKRKLLNKNAVWLCLTLFFCGWMVVCVPQMGWAQKESLFSFGMNETIRYDIRKMGVKVGSASFVFKGLQEVSGRPALLMVFTSQALNFYDEEQIYFDPQTFMPIMVKRDLNLWGKKEVITETYDDKRGEVQIVKRADGKTSRQTIKKTGTLDNIYCFIYRYRKFGSFQLKEKLALNLPTADVVIHPQKIGKIKTVLGEVESLFMESESKKYKIWFGTQDPRIPLRIDGALGFGKASLILDSYEAGK